MFRWAKNLSQMILLISLALLGLGGVVVAQSPADELHRVLVLQSYNVGYTWTDNVTGGIQSAMAESGLKYELYVEYMDTKRYPLEEMTPFLLDQYRQKYASLQPTVIIAVDNNALTFLLQYRDELFPGVPVVFCGINDFSDDLLQGQTGYTGVNEALNIAGTIELALAFHPNTKNIAVISDNTETGIKNLQTVNRALAPYVDQLTIFEFVNVTAEELQTSLANLPPNTIILMISFFYDKTGRYFSLPEFSSLIAQSGLPVYTFQDQFMGYGALGGVLLNGEDQAYTAVGQALEILQGKSPADIPIIRQSPTRPGFDYAVLQKFNIPLSKLPPHSVLFNEPQTAFYKYKQFIWITGIFIVLQSGIILALLVNINWRRQAQQSLALRVTQLSMLNDLGKQIAAVRNLETTLAHATRQVHQRFNYHHVGLFLLSPDQTRMVMEAKAGSYEHLFKPGHYLKLGQGMVGWVGQNNQTLLANNVTQEPRYVNSFPNKTEMVTQAELTVPIRIDGKPVGVLDVQSPQRNSFDENDVRVMETMADQLGVAIQNSRLYEALSQELADRRTVETALRQSEERYRLLFSHSPLGVFQFDPQGIIIECNDKFVEIIGSSKEKLIGLPTLTALRDQAMINAIKEALAGHVSLYEGDYHSVTASKSTPVRTIFNRITSEEDQCIGGMGLIEDMTERKHLEAQLQQAQKLEALGLLTGGIAHDFNNLLTAINGFAEILTRRLPPEQSTHAMAVNILKSGHRAADLVKQLLAFSRKQVMRPQIVNLNAIIADMETMLKRLVSENITLSFSLSPNLPLIKVDPIQVEQVILNLVVNANDAMPKGGKLIIETGSLSLTEANQSEHRPTMALGSYVVLTITDTGMGMSEEVMAHIFEPFFTTKSLGKGTGLGLATVFGIVKQSGGDIGAYSVEGQGTTFKIYLPVETETKLSPSPVNLETSVRSGTETILLVEDDLRVRQFAQQLLEDHGYRIFAAQDGQEALTFVRTSPLPIDLLLTDVILPGKSGREIADELRQIRPGLKVLFMSGYADNIIAYHGILDEGIHFLQKPFTVIQLAQSVRDVLDNKPVSPANRNIG